METGLLRIEPLGRAEALWCYRVADSGRCFVLAAPVLHVDGQAISAALDGIEPAREPLTLPNGAIEHAYRGRLAGHPNLSLELVFRLAADSPVVRFRYRLLSERHHALSKVNGRDCLTYLALSPGADCRYTELLLSEFDESAHSFRPTVRPVRDSAAEHGLTAMGPLLLGAVGGYTLLVGYEHGSQVPDAFLRYRFAPGGAVSLEAAKGNYADGQVLDADHPLETVWFQFAALAGDEEALARQFRHFVLHRLTSNSASRQPYIFYNTWNYQERNKWWNGRTFLESMNQERMLAEIEVAARMGIEVFVLDTGWYERTGDWRASRERFPDGLAEVRSRLEHHGMKLGLWFSPTQAAVSSRMARDHLDCRRSWLGQVVPPHEVWETEESYSMCLVSRYWQAFADELIRLARELDVRYFKWDAIGQYGCDDPNHWHGSAANTPEDRADRYAFELGRYMAKVAERLGQACPEAIVDFDITEGGRSVGLGFLAAGKYFAINNGPYYGSFDDPAYAPGGGMGSNVLVFPGPARARLCRVPLDYDRWIPSVLFLTHYLPDDPEDSQIINLASLVLGQNGIWGDLLRISDEGVARFGRTLAKYKQMRDEITASDPVRFGIVGGSPEVHEKIHRPTGKGAVSIFAGAPGDYTYITRNPVASGEYPLGDVRVSRDAAGRARLDVHISRPGGAALVLFGVAAELTTRR